MALVDFVHSNSELRKQQRLFTYLSSSTQKSCNLNSSVNFADLYIKRQFGVRGYWIQIKSSAL